MPHAIESDAAPAQAVVIGLEIPGFAKLPVAMQRKQQEELQRRLTAILHTVAPKDRMVLDTPTGAAVVLFSGPAVALNIACALCGTRSAESGSVVVRASLATGIVKVVSGAHDHPQIAGDALEVAELLVTLYQSERLVATGAFATTLRLDEPECAPAMRTLAADGPARDLEPVAIQITHPAVLALRRRRATQTKQLVRRLTAPRAVMATAAALLTVVIWSAVLVYGRASPPASAAVAVAPTSATAAVQAAEVELPDEDRSLELVTPVQAAAVPEESPKPEPVAAQPPLGTASIAKPRRGLHVKPPSANADRKVQESSIESADVLVQTAPDHGKVMLAIAPWGEVLVNGKPVGVSGERLLGVG